MRCGTDNTRTPSSAWLYYARIQPELTQFCFVICAGTQSDLAVNQHCGQSTTASACLHLSNAMFQSPVIAYWGTSWPAAERAQVDRGGGRAKTRWRTRAGSVLGQRRQTLAQHWANSRPPSCFSWEQSGAGTSALWWIQYRVEGDIS